MFKELNSKNKMFGYWNLGFVWGLVIGNWSLTGYV